MSDIISKNPKATILTTLTAILEASSQHIKDVDYKQIATPVAPFVALAITIIGKTAYQRYKCWGTCKMMKEWISDLQLEINDPATSKTRRIQASKEISQYKTELKTVQKGFIGFAFD